MAFIPWLSSPGFHSLEGRTKICVSRFKVSEIAFLLLSSICPSVSYDEVNNKMVSSPTLVGDHFWWVVRLTSIIIHVTIVLHLLFIYSTIHFRQGESFIGLPVCRGHR